MAKTTDETLFRRLTRLFAKGPVIKRRVKGYKGSSSSSAFEVFRKSHSSVYSNAMSAYGTYDRMARYSDFSEMEYTPEISSALDIYSEETVASDEKGSVLHIFSENSNIQGLLEDLFYDTLNIEFNLTGWARNLCKYGDFFLFNDVKPEFGVINTVPMPVSEVEREEGFNPEDPLSVRFRWVTQGNQVMENWQVSHFRLLGNDAFLPYGSSVLEAARRIWRQLILVEDAMLVYRVVRSPERRVFYVDVGNVPPEDIPNYMEQVQSTLKRSQVIDKDAGRVDLRYNPLSVDEDYFLPVRGSESGTRIDTLAGGTHTSAIEDVEYIQKKLFAALKIPKAYLGYDEGLGAKATLSQEDIRFSRTINRIQRTVISELNKVAIIHLFCHGYEGEDLLDFNLQLSNPSTIAQQQKLELYRSRFEIAGTAAGVEGLVDRDWLRKNVLGLQDEEIDNINTGRLKDKEIDLQVESVKLPEEKALEIGLETGIALAVAGGEEGAGEEMGGEMGGEFGEEEMLQQGDVRQSSVDAPVLSSSPYDDIVDIGSLSITDVDSPIMAQNKVSSLLSESLKKDLEDHDIDKEAKDQNELDEKNVDDPETLKKTLRNRKRRKKSHFVDHHTMTTHSKKNRSGKDSVADPHGDFRNVVNSVVRNPLSELKKSLSEFDMIEISDSDFIDIFLSDKITENAKMTKQLDRTLKSLESKISNNSNIISESDNTSEGG